MRDFENELETKLQPERTKIERKEFELELHMNKLEMQHQLLGRKREHERKLQITTLEKDDVRSQSTNSRDKSPFNWISKRKMSRIGPIR